MEASRILEVLHDRGDVASPRWLLGSGFLVRTGVVITAAHNLGDDVTQTGPLGTVVRNLDGDEHPASLLARCDPVDVALLAVPGLQARTVRMAKVDRERITIIRDVTAVGFPNYKYSHERPLVLRRQPAQPFGVIPTAEGASAGDLTLKVEGGEPAPPAPGADSPWQGLSGAGVFVEQSLVGIVTEHHEAEGLGSLRISPLSCLVDLSGQNGVLSRAILGLDDPTALDSLGGGAVEVETDPILTGIVRELQQVMSLGEQGLLTPTEVSALKLTAYKEAKGWS